MSVSSTGRSGVPTWRALASALVRPRLFSDLDRGASLTVLDAPPGFGKRTLLASWLQSGGAPGRRVVWVPPLEKTDEHETVWKAVGEVVDRQRLASADDHSGDPFERVAHVFQTFEEPCFLIFAGVPAAVSLPMISSIMDLLDRCPTIDVAVCLSGSGIGMSTIAERGIDCIYVSAEDLAFTPAETGKLFRNAGLDRPEREITTLHSALGGVPGLLTAAVTIARSHPGRLIDNHGAPGPVLTHLLHRYCTGRLDNMDSDLRAFTLSIVAAGNVTVEEAAELTEHPEPSLALRKLMEVGLLVRSSVDGKHAWSWPAAIRRVVLDVSRQERPGHADHLLKTLAHKYYEAGEPAPAANYAAEAGEWTMVMEIIEHSWVGLVSQHFDALVKVMRMIPDETAAQSPSIQAGRALFTQMLDEAAILHPTLPTTPAELIAMGKAENAADALYTATVQTLSLRVAGEMAEAAALTMRIKPLVDSILEHQPASIGSQLPLLRVQWAITLQLAGYLTESTIVFRRAYKGGFAANVPFIIQNAAGSSALNWALAGDNPRAREWLGIETRAQQTEGRWSEIVKAGGRAASVLVHLDELDLPAARARLGELGVPNESEELWGFVAYCHALYALTTHDAYDGLTGLHQMIAAHRDRHSDGAFSRILLGAAEVDLQLALGNGNLARALSDGDPRDHPLLVVPNARVELLTGHPDLALKKLRRVSWTDCGYPRAHLEALLIEATAQLDLEQHDGAVRSWDRACSLAKSLGNERAFATVPARALPVLEELSGTGVPCSAVPGRVAEAMFPDTVFRVELSPRETDVLKLLVEGSTHGEIAKALFVSPNTVKTQLRSIYRKLGAHTRLEAIARARELHLLPVTGAQ